MNRRIGIADHVDAMWNAASASARYRLCFAAAGLAALLIFASPPLAAADPGNGKGNGNGIGNGNGNNPGPSDPTNLAVASVSPTSITLTWKQSADRIGVAGYNLFSNGQKVGTTTTTTAVFGGFSCGTSEQIGVQAFDAAGYLSQIVMVMASTAPCPDTAPPSIPTGVAVTAATTTSVSLVWNASTDNVGVTGYDILVNGAKAGTSLTTNYTAGGLACGTLYNIAVDAYDAAGNRSSPTTVIASTRACGSTTSVTSAPTNSSPPTITGTPQTGQTLTATTGTWNGSPSSYAYQWQRCNSSGASCSSIAGANAQYYVLTTSDAGATIRVSVTAINSGGSATSSSAPTAVVTSTSLSSSGSPSGSSIYWGAYIEAKYTYAYLYGGTWSNAPWCDPGTQCPLPKFTQNAGKQPSIEHWGMCWTCSFDSGIANVVVGRGDIPAVDWSNSGVSDADVASGKYDSWLTTQAKAMASFGHPMFLLFDEEMNGSWYSYSPGQSGNTAADFVAMWRHIHDVFVNNGATNVTWVWCPNVDPNHTYVSLSSIYPGDSYVDWTGLNGYNWGGGPGGGWTTFSQVFGPSYSDLRALAPTKPIMIGEVSSEENGGSKASWITDALSTQVPQNYPQIKALLWFNWRVYEKSNYWNWEIESSPTAQQSFATAISSPYYAAGGKFGSLPLLTKVQPLP